MTEKGLSEERKLSSVDVQLPVLKSSSEEDGTQADYLDEQYIKTGSVNDDYGDVKQVQAAKVIQRTWRRHIDTHVFRYFKDLINFRQKGDPRCFLNMSILEK
ncbi:protein MFI [Acipenser oxyrinchus oxyrinchus]|uniref:Protein MFI n=1 Tax=Acipenser oxyrinchus oxyrinchus TaxID=40147 RepID=A0AAD8CFT5_ACIOX|nr:protein MFI [Acipenser oxyrinchus oxyrinchus]